LGELNFLHKKDKNSMDDRAFKIEVKTPGLIFLIKNKMVRSPFIFDKATELEVLNITTKIKTYVNVDFEITADKNEPSKKLPNSNKKEKISKK
jgi:hypothetical protein